MKRWTDLTRPRRSERSVSRTFMAFLMASSCGGGSGATPSQPGQPSPGPTPTPVPTPAARPNIVVITTDDLDNASISRMPNLRSLLIDRGITFTNSFVTTPLCCPSRASMLTGLYAHNHGVLINRPAGSLGQVPNCFEQFRDSGQESSTVNTWLRASGYRTGFVGKYLNRYPGDMPGANPRYVPPGWDDWYSQFSDSGNAYYKYSMNDNGNILQFGNRPQDYLTDVMTSHAVQLINTWSGDPARPFFVYVNPAAPHVPATPAPRHADVLFEDVIAPRTPNFNEPDMSDKPSWFRSLPAFDDDTISRLDGAQRQRLRTMLAVDDMIGNIVTALETSQALSNTYIIFNSDNGLLLGGHRLYLGKDAVYEESIKVPLIIRGPSVPQGKSLDHMVLNIDLAPTLADLARVAIPGNLDGKSMLPLLNYNPPTTSAWRTDFLEEHWTDQEEGLPDWFGVRTKNQIYVEYPMTRETEYYDLGKDPYQLDSQHAKAPASTLQPLAARLAALKGCRAPSCR